MLKKRIIPVQLLLGGRLVKTVKFDTYRDVGDPVASSRVYNAQNADELIFLNINREQRSIDVLLELIVQVSEVCFMPMSMGGGISVLPHASALIRSGADKVVVNSAVYRDHSLITQIADSFGAQAVVVAIDVRFSEDADEYQLYSDCGRTREAIELDEHIERCVAAGAGEFFINAICRDGVMKGYDTRLLQHVTERSSIPVIGCGGAGNYEHLRDAFVATGVSALACGSLFNFTDSNPLRAKAYLSNYGLKFKVV